jgi:hypothetical protein
MVLVLPPRVQFLTPLGSFSAGFIQSSPTRHPDPPEAEKDLAWNPKTLPISSPTSERVTHPHHSPRSVFLAFFVSRF